MENDIKIVPRDVTDSEAAFFQENGWVHLESLFSADDIAVMLERVRHWMGADAGSPLHPVNNGKISFFHMYEPLSISHETAEITDQVFYHLSHSAEFGRIGAKFVGEPVRYWIDGALVKMPSGGGSGAGPTNWHVDGGAFDEAPFAPAESSPMQFWVALTDIPFERGTMRFVGKNNQTDEVREVIEKYATDPVASYSILEEMGVISPALNMKAGDATLHSSTTFHSAPPNMSDQPRWVYINSVFPQSARYTGHDMWLTKGTEGMVVGETFPDRRFPVIA